MFSVGEKVIVSACSDSQYGDRVKNGMVLTVHRVENLGEMNNSCYAYWFVEERMPGMWEKDLKKANLKTLMGDKV